ncbi:MAG TPA: TlpA disulfide reductase family protein [Terracidiphilus sp.]|nr:TlpA disulfide reductase family protein [Terracidiphilus sp.]
MHARRSLPLVTKALLLAAALLASGALRAAPPPSRLLHQPAPEFARTAIDGQRIDLASYHGKVVLLTFWATWCAPCQIEIPHFIRWQRDLGPQGFQVVAVSMDDDAAPVLTLASRRPFNYPVIMGDEQLGTLYGGVLGLPVTFLIDRNGNVAAVFKSRSGPAAIKARIVRLLASQ